MEGSFKMVEMNNFISCSFTDCVQADAKHQDCWLKKGHCEN